MRKGKTALLALAVLAAAAPLRAAGGDSGLSIGVGLSHVELGRLSYTAKGYAGASPLGYTPLELGYRFSNGFFFKVEVQLAFYTAETQELESQYTAENQEYQAPTGRLISHEYEVTNFVVGGTYDVQLPFSIRPYVGSNVEILGATRRGVSVRAPDPLSGGYGPPQRVIGEKAEQAYNLLGASAVGGLRWKASSRWALHLEGRYLIPFGGVVPPVGMAGLGIKFLL